MTNTTKLILGQTLYFNGNPLTDGLGAVEHHRHGAVLVEGGKISWVGPADHAAPPIGVETLQYGEKLIMAGFVDAHLHYPQTAMIASWGKRLIEWLNTFTFPEETRFGDAQYADLIAKRYFDLAVGHGTTSMCSYATIHPESVNAFFSEGQRRGIRAYAGKTCMDRNAPDGLRDDAQSSYDDSKALAEKWHGKDRLGYVITPRFSPTSSPEQLEALGALWAEKPDCLMQTHISEQLEEIAWVRELFPDARDYLDTYERYGLLGKKAVYGHAIHLTEREKARLLETGAGLAHCPTSNTFIGSGIFDMKGLSDAGQNIGLATDIGGGSSFSMLRTMAAAYEIGQLNGTALHPAELLWLATCGSAKVLHTDDLIGNLAAGMEADIVVLDLSSTPAIAQRHAKADTIWESIFPTIMMGDDRAISDVFIAGELAPKPVV